MEWATGVVAYTYFQFQCNKNCNTTTTNNCLFIGTGNIQMDIYNKVTISPVAGQCFENTK